MSEIKPEVFDARASLCSRLQDIGMSAAALRLGEPSTLSAIAAVAREVAADCRDESARRFWDGECAASIEPAVACDMASVAVRWLARACWEALSHSDNTASLAVVMRCIASEE